MGQPLGTGAKVAIGCVGVLILGGIVTMVLLGGAFWWGKGKMAEVSGEMDKFVGEQKRIEELTKKANATPFEQPADGVIKEDQLLKFLEIRKRVHSVYQKYERDIEARGKKEKPDLGDVGAAFGMINEIRGAQARAQADLGMSDDEYRFLVHQVYKTMWASEVAKDAGGKSVSEAAGEAYDKAARAMQQAAEEARDAEARARSRGDEAAAELSEETRKAVGDGAEQLERQSREVHDRARDMDVPPANIALFQKYEADIKKYAMSGLEWIGL
jgi:hypothetical protein